MLCKSFFEREWMSVVENSKVRNGKNCSIHYFVYVCRMRHDDWAFGMSHACRITRFVIFDEHQRRTKWSKSFLGNHPSPINKERSCLLLAHFPSHQPNTQNFILYRSKTFSSQKLSRLFLFSIVAAATKTLFSFGHRSLSLSLSVSI
jgi:hypothetical protein